MGSTAVSPLDRLGDRKSFMRTPLDDIIEDPAHVDKPAPMVATLSTKNLMAHNDSQAEK